MSSLKALILLTSRPETVGIAVEKLRPKVIGVIFSQEVLEVVVAKCSELRSGRAGKLEFRYRLVDSPMEIGDAFERFEHLLSEPEELGFGHDKILLDAGEACVEELGLLIEVSVVDNGKAATTDLDFER